MADKGYSDVVIVIVKLLLISNSNDNKTINKLYRISEIRPHQFRDYVHCDITGFLK